MCQGVEADWVWFEEGDTVYSKEGRSLGVLEALDF